MINKMVKALTPYGALRLVEKMREPPPLPASALFDGEDALFKSILATTRVYGEYGCGASTKWVLANTGAQVLAVDTSRHWIEEVIGALSADELERAAAHHIDLGALGEWGRPTSYAKRAEFSAYTDWIWMQPSKPDTVLIDGRFRVCAFLTSLKFAAAGTRLLFDDYTIRPMYHIVEQYVPREEACGRQCLFIVPGRGDIDHDRLNAEINNFRHVMD